uniref:Uncharacterized protein n=1 Tax=Triticum urartu TaxID=4572 RepID=A0A8R7Q157_TRIUA
MYIWYFFISRREIANLIRKLYVRTSTSLNESSHLHDLAHCECGGHLSCVVPLSRLAALRMALKSAILARIVRQQLACTVATCRASRLSWQNPLKRAMSGTRALTPRRRNTCRRFI